MTDLRTRLKEALWEHQKDCDLCSMPTSPAHARDMLLLLDGIAVVERADLNQLLAVAQLYVDAFSEDEMMTLPEKLRLQEIERILAAADAAEGAK